MVAKSETFGGSLDDVRAFCAVVDFGTITAAARELVETKGSVSRRIARLETAIGIMLLARSPRAVSVLDAGLEFYDKASAALALLDEAGESVRNAQDVLRGTIRITASHDFANEILPTLIVDFRELHPQINFDLVASDSPLDLTANRIDLALRVQMGDPADGAHQALYVADADFGVFASPSYLAQHPAVQAPEDLVARALIFSRERPGRTHLSLMRGQEEFRFALRPAIRASDFACVARLAVAGAGIALLPTMLARGWIDRGELLHLIPAWAFRGAKLYALTAPGRKMAARVRAFRDFVVQALRTGMAVSEAERR